MYNITEDCAAIYLLPKPFCSFCVNLSIPTAYLIHKLEDPLAPQTSQITLENVIWPTRTIEHGTGNCIPKRREFEKDKLIFWFIAHPKAELAKSKILPCLSALYMTYSNKLACMNIHEDVSVCSRWPQTLHATRLVTKSAKKIHGLYYHATIFNRKLV
jgi:hypothetical protein